MRNKFPGQTMIAVEEHELDALQEIAACFRDGDADRIANIGNAFEAHCSSSMTFMSSSFVRAHLDTLRRLQAAAKLAEDL